MCGINGIFSIAKSLPDQVESLVSAMNSSISHRGPDDSGININQEKGFALGHLRLSILDLTSSGHQPMLHDDGSAIVFNGEIYNFLSIKKNLTNINFKSNSDTEVLLHLYNKEGHQCLEQLNGMFAFTYYDSKKEELLLARDRAGKKPLYYNISNGYFSFSSEIKALLTLPWIKNELDQEAFYNFLTFNNLDAPQTMFKGICKLAPGECMTVNKHGNISIHSYYKINYQDYSKYNESTISDKLFELLDDSVKLRMVADVPVGAFLSGGVDSSAVVALMRKYSSHSIKTYSVGFADQQDYDERIYAEKIAKQYNTDHFEKLVTKDDIKSFLPKIVDVFDEPMADSTCIPIYFISSLARENGTIVVQTGDGADEIFFGYRGWKKYAQLYPWYNSFSKLPDWIKYPISKFSKVLDETSPLAEIIQRGYSNQELFWGGAKAFKEHTKKQFLNEQYLESLKGYSSYKVIEKHFQDFQKLRITNPFLSDVDWMCYIGYKYIIPSKYLYRMDRLGMANSIEIRNPFLDYRLVDYGLSIPFNLKTNNNEPKYILKKSLERILPNEVLYRKKMGFCVPLREWAGDIMIDYVTENMNEFCSNTDIFKKEGLTQHLKEIKNGNQSYTNNLWTIYFTMMWFKRWMNQ